MWDNQRAEDAAKAQAEAEEAEAKAKREGTWVPKVKKVAIIEYTSEQSPLELAVEDSTSVLLKELTESFHRLDFKKTSEVETGLAFANSMVDHKFTLGEFLSSLESDLKSTEDQATVVVAVLQKLYPKGKKAYLTALGSTPLDRVNDFIRGGRSGPEFDAFLQEQNLYFLKPVLDMTEEVAAALKQGSTPDAILKAIDSKIEATQSPSNLTPLIAAHVLGLVFTSKTELNLDAIDAWAPVLVRCQSDVEAEMKILFAAQRVWFRAGKQRKFVRPLFEKFYEAKIVSFDGLACWRDDSAKANKKGKAFALLGVNNWITEITPIVIEEEDEEEEDEEEPEVDAYLRNPNSEFF